MSYKGLRTPAAHSCRRPLTRLAENGSQGYADFSNHVVGKLPAGTFEPPASCRNAHTRQQMNHMAMIVPSVGMLTAAWWLL